MLTRNSDPNDTAKDSRSLGELFGELGRNTSNLVRQEVQLAKTELMQKADDFRQKRGVFSRRGRFRFRRL